MTSDTPAAPIQQREVEFYEDRVVAVLLPNEGGGEGSILVPVRPICDQLGISWSGQRDRINRDPVLREVKQGVRVTRTPEQGGAQEMLCLPVEYLNGWLFGISVTRVRGELQDKIIRYQRDCYRVLWDAFRPDVLRALGQQPDVGALTDDVAHIRLGVDGILDYLWQSRQHDELVRRLIEMTRVEVLEVGGLLQDGTTLTEAQRRTLYQLGLEVAVLLGQAGERQNGYAIVFGGLKKHFGIGKKGSYRDIPRDKYREAYEFLANWKAATQSDIRNKGEEPCIL